MPAINKILFITLSNMGDVILTLPVLDYLRQSFPESKITVMVGPRPKALFENNPAIERLIIYDKYSRLRQKFKLFLQLRKEKFNIVIDLRNTMFGVLLPGRYKTSPFLVLPRHIRHMKERNLYRLVKALKANKPLDKITKGSFFASNKDKEYVEALLKENKINASRKIIVISPATGGGTRKWDALKFAQLCDSLSNAYELVLIGSKDHRPLAQYIKENCRRQVYDFMGLTTFSQLAYLLEKSALLITGDTGTLQIASYLNTPIVALFGPSDEYKYGAWSDKFRIVKREIFCRPCKKAQCPYGTVACMKLITVDDVLAQIKDIMGEAQSSQRCDYKRILIVRTDRIGDVLLSTPVIRALRGQYPNAYIAMMVSPYAKDIIEENPYLDEVIIYDKDRNQKDWLQSFKFARELKKKKFDLALVLHPTNRAHLITFLARIPERLGYDRKFAFLLTKKFPHTKQEGRKHEVLYNLDLLKGLGINAPAPDLYMPIKIASENWVDELFRKEKIDSGVRLLALHPGASCISKIWPAERFAEVADRLIKKYGFKVLIVAGQKDIELAARVKAKMINSPIDLSGKTTISQLASILKRCSLFISNDSGPMHIAAAVGTAVIAIFGRNQAGLSQTRWGPLGKKSYVLHKEVGCKVCLAHNCQKQFACLNAVTTDDVINIVDSILPD